ncbi:MAG: Cys-Gln thioester bond-forming surface protein [Streptococcaceae bacterium]|jgi:hypothetical protein|nr:Cys-Gln thioester bond-forming surface protein [Streptococcaceae bacterium]
MKANFFKSKKATCLQLAVVLFGVFASLFTVIEAEASTVSFDTNLYAYVTVDGIEDNLGHIRVDGQSAYCIEPFARLDETSEGHLDMGADGYTKLSQTQKDRINNIAYASFNNGTVNANTNPNMYAAAQMLIWETVGNHDVQYVRAGANNLTDLATVNSYKTILNNVVNQLNAVPSFNNTTVDIKAGTNVVLTDTNNAISKFTTLASNPNKIKYSISGNQLTLSADTNTIEGNGTLTLATPAQVSTPLVWGTITSSGTVGQTVYQGGDPVRKMVKINFTATKNGSLKITKIDAEDEATTIAGAKYAIYQGNTQITKDVDGNTLPNLDANGWVTTGADGTVTVNKLMYGDYKIVEKYVPAPYVVGGVDDNGNPIPTEFNVTVVAGTTSANPTGITFSDMHQKGIFEINKKGLYGGNMTLNDSYSLAGNQFEIKDTTKNTVVGIIETDATGFASTVKDINGNDLTQQLSVDHKYTIQEIKAGNGFGLTFNDGKPLAVELNYSGNPTQIVNPTPVTTVAVNQEVLGKSTLTKVDKDYNESKPQGSATLKGANYTLYYGVDVKKDGQVIHAKDTPVSWTDGFETKAIKETDGTRVTNSVEPSENTVTLEVSDKYKVGVENLPQATYYWKETKASVGYSLDLEKYEFIIAKEDDSSLIITQDLTAKQQVIRFNMNFFKKVVGDTVNAGVNGAEFKLKPASDDTLPIDTSVGGANDTTVTKNFEMPPFSYQGYGSFLNTPYGTYEMYESKTPNGYEAIKPLIITPTFNEDKDNYENSTYTFTVTEKGNDTPIGTPVTVSYKELTSGAFMVGLPSLELFDHQPPEVKVDVAIQTQAHAGNAQGDQVFTYGTKLHFYDDVRITHSGLEKSREEMYQTTLFVKEPNAKPKVVWTSDKVKYTAENGEQVFHVDAGEIDTAKYAEGSTFYFSEKNFYKDEENADHNKDGKDTKQELFPEQATITTLAHNGKFMTYKYGEKIKLSDDVSITHKGVIPSGAKETFKTTLVAVEPDGKATTVWTSEPQEFEVKATNTFKINAPEIDTAKFAKGTYYTFTETLYDNNGDKVTSHNDDFKEKSQTIYPETNVTISTKAHADGGDNVVQLGEEFEASDDVVITHDGNVGDTNYYETSLIAIKPDGTKDVIWKSEHIKYTVKEGKFETTVKVPEKINSADYPNGTIFSFAETNYEEDNTTVNASHNQDGKDADQNITTVYTPEKDQNITLMPNTSQKDNGTALAIGGISLIGLVTAIGFALKRKF